MSRAAPGWEPDAPPPVTPQRLAQVVAFLREIGLDPSGPGGLGGSATALAPIEEALTHSSLGKPLNHERLEFLGDAVLRLAASEFLRREHGGLSVGNQSALRGQLVSDRWLADLAHSCGLEKVVRLGAMASGDSAGRATVLAESAEALLGGIYLVWGGPQGGLEAVIRWLTPHWRDTAAAVLADPHRHNWKSALQEWSQARGYGLPRYHCEERTTAHGDPRRFFCTVYLEAGNAPTTMGRVPSAGGTGRGAMRPATRAARHTGQWVSG
jgi:ribonuclease-3